LVSHDKDFPKIHNIAPYKDGYCLIFQRKEVDVYLKKMKNPRYARRVARILQKRNTRDAI